MRRRSGCTREVRRDWAAELDAAHPFPLGVVSSSWTHAIESTGAVMTKTLTRIAILLSVFIIVVFGIFLFNQTAQIVQSARLVNARFGDGVLWALVFLY